MGSPASRCAALCFLLACFLSLASLPASADILSPFVVPSVHTSVAVLNTRSQAKGESREDTSAAAHGAEHTGCVTHLCRCVSVVLL